MRLEKLELEHGAGTNGNRQGSMTGAACDRP
jgi:hypothetical protein